MLLSIVTAVFQILQVNAGNGKHVMFVSFPVGVEDILRNLFWSIIFYNASLMFTKVSILLQYGRIFTLREMRIPLHIITGICVAWGISSIFVSIFMCVPVRAYWKILEQATARCSDNKTLWYTCASINIMTDLMVAILPVRVIWSLQIAIRPKIALLCILTIGWFVCVLSILRLHALVVLVHHPEDTTWYSAPTAYWSAIEMNLAIVCASLPALKPLMAKIAPGFLSHHSRGSSGRGRTALSDKIKNITIGSKKTYNEVDDDLESGNKSYSSKGNRSTSEEEDVYLKNIYVSRSFEQNSIKKDGHLSDSDSQKDLVEALPQTHTRL
ncbi:hypothetical protein N0V83_005426 [Neocucurbitaria cava]|uniref:Rhodopsin domain-containing protein n=1 Tax=Neocucurbitaria cava TaxID=798079 RepID=A0A9W8Y794_9PLEO|nr:hypothetical protein N0V83_005426 [Neocucurbitaria cava]